MRYSRPALALALFFGVQGPLCTLYCMQGAEAADMRAATASSGAESHPCHRGTPASSSESRRGNGCGISSLDHCSLLAQAISPDASCADPGTPALATLDAIELPLAVPRAAAHRVGHPQRDRLGPDLLLLKSTLLI